MDKTFKASYKFSTPSFVRRSSILLDLWALRIHQIAFKSDCIIVSKRIGESYIISADEIKWIELETNNLSHDGKRIMVYIYTDTFVREFGIYYFNYPEVISTLITYCGMFDIRIKTKNFDVNRMIEFDVYGDVIR